MDRPAAGREAIAIAFLKRYLADRTNAEPRSLPDYQAMFPGFESLVAEEYEKVAEGSEPSSIDRSESGASVGRYHLLRALGRGGQADVFLAEDSTLGRQVAIKVLRRWVGAPQAVLKRFRREAALASRLDHPSISTVFETGLDDGVPYIVMRYVEGDTLGELIPTGIADGPIGGDDNSSSSGADRSSVRRFARIIEDTARAVHAAHAENVVHRDLKPSNILITTDDTPVVLDFGLARSLDHETDATFTQPGDLFGTPSYMSPEQLTAHHVPLDARTDIYSLGVTLYECLTGRRPFEARTREGLYQAILTKPAPPIRERSPAVPRDLEVIVETAMAKDRDHRYQTALDFADDLARWRLGEPIEARAVGPLGRLARWTRREPIRAGLVAACLVITAGGGYAIAEWPRIRADRSIAEAHARRDALESHLARGYLALAHRVPQEAIRAFDAALALDPASAEAIAGRVLADDSDGNKRAAFSMLDRFEATTGRSYPRIRCELLIRAGRGEEARRREAALGEPEDHVECFIAALIRQFRYWETKDPEIAKRGIDYIERAVFLAPRARTLYMYMLAEIAGRAGDAPAARHAAAALRSRGVGQPHALFSLALATSAFDKDTAITLYRRLLKTQQDTNAMSNLASLLSGRGETDGALRWIARARDLRPKQPLLASNHASIALTAGRRDEAIEAMQAFRKLMPGDIRWHYRLAHALADAERGEEAVEVCQDAVRVEPDNALHEGKLAFTLARLGRRDDAIEAIRRAIAIDPDDPRFHAELGKILSDGRDFDGATAAYRELVALEPKDPDALYRLAGALIQAGAPGEAISILERSRAIEDSHRTCYRLGYACNLVKRYQDGADAYRAAIAHRETAQAHFNLGTALDQLRLYRDAARSMRRSLELRGKPWSKSLMKYIDEVTKLSRAESDLDAYMGDTLGKPGFDRLFMMARVASRKERPRAAAKLWRELLGRFESRTIERDSVARIRAASAAIQAADDSVGDEATRWRREALASLRSELQVAIDAHATGEIDAKQLAERMKRLAGARSLRPLRSRQHLATLPDDERDEWLAFWRAARAAEEATKR